MTVKRVSNEDDYKFLQYRGCSDLLDDIEERLGHVV